MSHRIVIRIESTSFAAMRSFLAKVLTLACCVLLCSRALSQSPAPANAAAGASNPAPAKEKPTRVTTTVVVHGEVKDDYLPETVTVGTLDGATLQQTPLSATIVTRDLLNDQVSRLLSDVVKNDASIGEDYAPVGY